MENTIQDVRFALRGWAKAPGFAITAIGTMALGIGATTAIFSDVSGALLRPLPFADPENLVQLYETQPADGAQGGFHGPVVYRDFEEWRTRSRLFEGMITYSNSSKNLQGAGEPEQVATVTAERGLFSLLGVAALAGRAFGESDAPDVAVASYRFWKRHFGGDRSAVGRGMTLDGQTFTLIGIMPDGFQFPYRSSGIDLWVPWSVPAEMRSRPNARLDAVLGRLKQGAAMEAARQELAAMEGPSRANRQVRIRPLKDVVSGQARDQLLWLLGAVGMVLLVACVNVANLLLARMASRSREIAIRAALGAGKLRLMRQFLTESLLLAMGGELAGLAIGVWGSRALVKIAGAQIPRAEEIGLDWRLFAFLLAVCVTTGIGFGLGPAMMAVRGGASAMKSGGTHATLRDALTVVEVATAFILLAGAGLLLQTFLNLQRIDSGVNAENVLTMHVVVSGARESMAIEERVAQAPGVGGVGMISLLPLQHSDWSGFLTIDGRPGRLPAQLRYVTPGYFRAMGIPLRRGRGFSSRDDAQAPRVIVVNEALAREYFPGEDPVGRTTDRGLIVGVVGDVRQEKLSVPAKPEIYYAVAQNFAQIRAHGSTLVVRSGGSAEALGGLIRAAVREASPGQALFRVATMREVIEESLANPRLYAWLLGIFAATGTLLAAAGIHGVIAHLVALRTREFGIRMALGADTGRVLRLVMNRGVALIAVGLLLGIGGAALLTQVLRGVLYGVAATDPAILGSMAGLLAAVALAACLVPALRAARVNPAVALRSE
ncbi:MAG: ABC transporter permease [Bryobacteraceae bacterium]